jgi:solute carrier family 25 protein 39/40
MIYFSVYEQLKKAWTVENGSSKQDTFSFVELAAGVTAGGTGALATQPLDFVKTRIQVGRQCLSGVLVEGASTERAGASKGMLETIRHVIKTEGVHPIFRGSVARVCWLAPGCGITIAVFESTQRYLGKLE